MRLNQSNNDKMILPEGPNLITKRETSQDRITLTPGIEFGKVQFNSTVYERVIVDKMFLRRTDFKLNTIYNPLAEKLLAVTHKLSQLCRWILMMEALWR